MTPGRRWVLSLGVAGLGLAGLAGFARPRGGATAPDLVQAAARADLDRVGKAARRLTLWQGGREIARYSVVLGFAPVGPKQRAGDGRTPEGVYRIDRRNAQSAYHLSLGLDYPLPPERAAAAARGEDPGGDIFIHGQPNRLAGLATLPHDWTAGCIALSDADMREVWARVDIGTRVEVVA